MYIYHANPYNQSSFVFQVKSIPTCRTPPMNIGFQLISLPCHIHNQPISYSSHDKNLYKFIIHNSHTLPFHAYSFISYFGIAIQPSMYLIPKTKIETVPTHPLAQLSLRLEALAQARGVPSLKRQALT